MKVTIRREQCISCGACWAVCPEFFEENPEDALSQVVDNHRCNACLSDGEAPEALRACVLRAAGLCSVDIITVRESIVYVPKPRSQRVASQSVRPSGLTD